MCLALRTSLLLPFSLIASRGITKKHAAQRATACISAAISRKELAANYTPLPIKVVIVIVGRRIPTSAESAVVMRMGSSPSNISECNYLCRGHCGSMRSRRHSMSEETSYQRDARVHCFLNGRFECECGEEWPDEVLAEMIWPAAVDAVRHELA